LKKKKNVGLPKKSVEMRGKSGKPKGKNKKRKNFSFEWNARNRKKK